MRATAAAIVAVQVAQNFVLRYPPEKQGLKVWVAETKGVWFLLHPPVLS